MRTRVVRLATEPRPRINFSVDAVTVVGKYTMEAQRGEEAGGGMPEGMSKNQWKKLLKRQRIEKGRAEWKKKQKEKEKEKKWKKREEGHASAPPSKRHKMSVSTASPVRVAIELGYQDLMNDLDIKSLIKQCQRCYAANRRAETPLQLYLTSFGGQCKQRMDQTVQGYTHWDVHFKAGDYVEVFGRENVVFLAAESPNVLTDFSPDKVYVIGGLVDHNHHKGHCYQSALSKGVAHAQLPISEYIALNSRKVLTVNHVFEIVLAYVQSQDWKASFHKVIPLRKQATESTHTPKPLPLPHSSESPHSDTDSSTTTTSTTFCKAPTTSATASLLESNTTTCTSITDVSIKLHPTTTPISESSGVELGTSAADSVRNIATVEPVATTTALAVPMTTNAADSVPNIATVEPVATTTALAVPMTTNAVTTDPTPADSTSGTASTSIPSTYTLAADEPDCT